MKVEVSKSFVKDISKITDKKLAVKLQEQIAELENCNSLNEITNIKKMIVKGNYYRIRVGNFRLGLEAESDTINLLRFMDRKEIYRYFP